MKDLNKSQLILLALLLSFVTSIATGITTVTLMEQAPSSVTVPINRIIKQTVEKIVPVETAPALTEDEKKIIEELKAVKPLTVSLYMKGEKSDKLLGTGIFFGEDKVIISSPVTEPKEGEVYVVKSVLGEKKVSSLTSQKDFTVVELEVDEIPEDDVVVDVDDDNTDEANIKNTNTNP